EAAAKAHGTLPDRGGRSWERGPESVYGNLPVGPVNTFSDIKNRITYRTVMASAVIPYETRLSRDPRWALREGSAHFAKNNSVWRSVHKIAARLSALELLAVLRNNPVTPE